MDKQVVIDTLRDALNDSKAIERKLRALLRDQGIPLSDAPYGFASGLTRLEDFRDDIRTALSEFGEE